MEVNHMSKKLVAYFSASGVTAKAAKELVKTDHAAVLEFRRDFPAAISIFVCQLEDADDGRGLVGIYFDII